MAEVKTMQLYQHARKKLTGGLLGCFELHITKDGKLAKQFHWVITKTGASYGEGPAPSKVDVVITCNDEDFLNLVAGKAQAPGLFMSGSLKLKGNMTKALKVNSLFQELAGDAAKKYLATAKL
mmetsp:Transcript_8880/g.20355  ORF Transcript_8880/g.20355 Transcript_8880/m.20355 type:complete len:123 (-) Transcript_8880:17-385(-)